MEAIEKVNDYLTQAQTFYLTTIDGEKPKCRPIAFHMIVDGTLYFGVGAFKNVYRQMTANPSIELCACKGQGFLRYYGTAVFEETSDIAEMALEAAPVMRQIYNDQTGYKLGIVSLRHATAEFRNMMGVEESYSL